MRQHISVSISILAFRQCLNVSTAADEFARLREHFSDDAIIELTALIAFQNLSSKFNAALQVPPQGFCALSPVLSDDPTI